MLHLLGQLPQRCYVAVSGGVDSMAVLDFLVSGKKDVTVLYFNHKTEYGEECQKFLEKYTEKRDLKFKYGTLRNVRKDSKKSQEEYWRIERYWFLDQFKDAPVITCHHLDDAMETWLFSSMNGEIKIIPHKRDNYLRPFLLNRKSELVKWAVRKNVPWIDDPSNKEVVHMRNKIRHEIMPRVLEINPGFGTVVKKKIIENFKNPTR